MKHEEEVGESIRPELVFEVLARVGTGARAEINKTHQIRMLEHVSPWDWLLAQTSIIWCLSWERNSKFPSVGARWSMVAAFEFAFMSHLMSLKRTNERTNERMNEWTTRLAHLLPFSPSSKIKCSESRSQNGMPRHLEWMNERNSNLKVTLLRPLLIIKWSIERTCWAKRSASKKLKLLKFKVKYREVEQQQQ